MIRAAFLLILCLHTVSGVLAESFTGEVTFVDADMRLGFVQNERESIGFVPPAQSVKLGDVIRVSGVVTQRGSVRLLAGDEAGTTAAMIEFDAAEPIGPVPKRPLQLELAADLRVNGLSILAHGALRAVERRKIGAVSRVVLEISSARGFVTAIFADNDDPTPYEAMIDHVVQLRGVLIGWLDASLPEAADGVLLLPKAAALVDDSKNLNAIFRQASLSAAEAMMHTRQTRSNDRLHVEGSVLWSQPGQDLYLRTREGSVRVSTRQRSLFKAGAHVSIACWPAREGGRLQLQDGIIRQTGADSPPAPLPATAENLLGDSVADELIRVQGTLTSMVMRGKQARLHIDVNGRAGAAWWAQPDVGIALAPGSLVQLTGICTRSSGRSKDGADFTLLLRDSRDITLLKTAPWWNEEHIGFTATLLTGISLFGSAWIMLLRWQVRRQSQLFATAERARAISEERRRISREFHDSLEQQLVGVALLVDVAKKSAPEDATLSQAKEMLRHCQQEVRRSIHDLREGQLAENGVETALRHWLAEQQASNPEITLALQTSHALPRQPAELELHLFRITQEAVNNALKHAKAQNICVKLEDGLLSIEDDGAGFDISLLKSTPRLGLRGMNERAVKLNSLLEITSAAGKGTRIILRTRHT